jgi:ubiquinol-cytochrome c reductase subunit 7
MTTSISLLSSLKSLRSKNSSFLKITEMYRNAMGYRQMGLLYDDLIPDEGELVQEALRRLPPNEYYERIFRFRRAINLSIKKEELPKEEWTTAEKDVGYLRPILQQVELEFATIQNFDNLEIPEALKTRNRV